MVLPNQKITSNSSPITAICFQLRKDGKQNKNRRSRRLETPSPEREIGGTQTETPISGNVTLTNNNTDIQGNLGENFSAKEL